MSQMKELYEKVAANNTLQEKFAEIMKNAEAAGKEATEAKLIAFAKDAGFDVSLEEAKAFFREKAKTIEELGDMELEMVAGGKQNIGEKLLNMLKSPIDYFESLGKGFENIFLK